MAECYMYADLYEPIRELKQITQFCVGLGYLCDLITVLFSKTNHVIMVIIRQTV